MSHCDHEEILEMGYTDITPNIVFNRDGQYYDRAKKIWWFEVGYHAYTKSDDTMFLYTLAGYDRVILSDKEAAAVTAVLNVTRDPGVKKHLQKYIQAHTEAIQLRDVGRNAAKSAMRFR
jgi:hypothetical protein